MSEVAGWVIVLDGSRNLIGLPARPLQGERVTKAPVRLSPVYELAMQTVATAKGPATFRTIRPLLMFGEIVEVDVATGMSVLLVDELSVASRVDLERGVANAKVLAAELRSGIVTT